MNSEIPVPQQNLQRWSVSLSWFTLLSAIWLVSVYNIPFWNTVLIARKSLLINDISFTLSAFTVLVLIFNSSLALLTFPRFAKPAVIMLVLLSAIAASFSMRLGVLIDKSMIQNVFETDWAEATALITPSFVLDFALLGLLPAVIISRIRIHSGTLRHVLRTKFVTIFCGIAVSVLLIWMFSAEYASMLRNHRELRFMLTPTNMVNSTYGYLKRRYRQPKQIETANDIRRALRSPDKDKPSVLILIVGETARAADFSLGSHDRSTNPLLATKDVLYFSNVRACGTSTAVSLPCMFSDLGKASYSLEKARGRENLIDILAHAGLDVIWLDNNSGCKNICARASYESLASRNDRVLCPGNECLDEVLVKALQDRVTGLTKDTVLIMHMKGSHGPAYFRRYPQRFESFKLACKSVDLSNCNLESIHNAYDNTILYTDFILSSIIDILRKNSHQINSSLLYISDHGESLGENGLYLHGIPEFMAPSTQTEIPIIVWLSERFSLQTGINQACMKDRLQLPYSHDYFFHTVLGLWNIKTSWYKDSLDMFAPCRSA
jgi:lipid A ethanolaminephosphotransferase